MKKEIIIVIISLVAGFLIGGLIFNQNNKQDCSISTPLEFSILEGKFSWDNFELKDKIVIHSEVSKIMGFGESDCTSDFQKRFKFNPIRCYIEGVSTNLLNTHLDTGTAEVDISCKCLYK